MQQDIGSLIFVIHSTSEVWKLLTDILEVKPQVKSSGILQNGSINVRVNSQSDKSTIFRNGHKLHGHWIGITDDLFYFEKVKRRELSPLLKAAKAERTKAFIRRCSLQVKRSTPSFSNGTSGTHYPKTGILMIFPL